MKKTINDYFTLFLKGIGMGAADVVPGVSGGTIAFITGIYDELLGTIKGLIPSLKCFLGPDSFWKKCMSFWTESNLSFLCVLLLGILTAVLSLAKGVTYMLATHPIWINAFFFGLILASIPLVTKKVGKWKVLTVVFALVGVFLAFLLPESTTVAGPTVLPLWFLFLCGAIGICAMILPGISGSFILVLLGGYNAVMHALSDFNFLYLIVFASGALIGILAFSNFLSWLLKRYHDLTVALLSGFILGSLKIIWPWKVSEMFIFKDGIPFPEPLRNGWPSRFAEVNQVDAQIPEAIGFALLGICLVVGIEWLGKRLGKKS